MPNMRQTRLDEKTDHNSSAKNEEPAKEQSAAGNKRKEPTADESSDQTSNDERTKSRKAEKSTDGDEQNAKPQKAMKQDAPAPTKLSGDQIDTDKKLKGDDVEINEDNSDGKKEVPWHVSEKGVVYFFYRPKVQSADKADSNSTGSLDDVQNTFMLLVPRASESDTAPASSATKEEQGDKREPPNPTAYRLISLGKKRLPSPEAALKKGQEPGGIGGRHSEAIWATVAEIGADLKAVADGMGEQRYSTKTRGERLKPAVRPAGRGHYALTIKTTDPPSSREVRITYHLSHPSDQDFGQVQEELGLHPASSVLVQMRNPTLAPTGPGAPAAGLPEDQRAILTQDELQENFGGDVKNNGNRYARPEEPALLDRQGVELLLIKRDQQEDDGSKGLGDEQSEALAKLAEQDRDNLADEAILKELALSSKDIKVDPLSGEWI